MKKVRLQDFEELLQASDRCSISIYLNTDEVGLAPHKRRTELQNALKTLLKKLQDRGESKQTLQNIIERFEEVQADEQLKTVNQKALAIFVTPERYIFFQLPTPVKNLTHVSHHFHVKPLITLLSNPKIFYLLALAKKSVVLYKGDLYSMRKVAVPDLPENFVAVVGEEADSRHLQFHTQTSGATSGKRPAAFHGHSSSWKDDKQRYLERFTKAVASVVEKFLNGRNDPLVLAGTEQLLTTYQKVNNYPGLVHDVVLHEKDGTISLSHLHKSALEQLEPFFLKKEQTAVQEQLSSGDENRFTLEIDEILRQAYLGRVDTVLVAQGVREWGQFEPEALSVQYLSEEDPGAHDLLDLACWQTLLHGGKAYVLPQQAIPTQSKAAAVFRY